MNKVYLVQSTKRRHNETGELVDRFNIEPALRYGQIIELLPGGPVITSTAPMITTLRYKLRNYSDRDYILAIGGPAEIGAAVAIAAAKNGGRVNMLVWDKPTRSYVVVPMDIHGHRVAEELEHG